MSAAKMVADSTQSDIPEKSTRKRKKIVEKKKEKKKKMTTKKVRIWTSGGGAGGGLGFVSLSANFLSLWDKVNGDYTPARLW